MDVKMAGSSSLLRVLYAFVMNINRISIHPFTCAPLFPCTIADILFPVHPCLHIPGPPHILAITSYHKLMFIYISSLFYCTFSLLLEFYFKCCFALVVSPLRAEYFRTFRLHQSSIFIFIQIIIHYSICILKIGCQIRTAKNSRSIRTGCLLAV